jgi:aminobenzoyl-glutamate transport protein
MQQAPSTWVTRALDKVERVGNKLPDPAIIFFICLIIIWVCSAIFSQMSFDAVDPCSIGLRDPY